MAVATKIKTQGLGQAAARVKLGTSENLASRYHGTWAPTKLMFSDFFSKTCGISTCILKTVALIKMAAVYKSLMKSGDPKESTTDGAKKPKQRVLILSSRGITYRFDGPLGSS